MIDWKRWESAAPVNHCDMAACCVSMVPLAARAMPSRQDLTPAWDAWTSGCGSAAVDGGGRGGAGSAGAAAGVAAGAPAGGAGGGWGVVFDGAAACGFGAGLGGCFGAGLVSGLAAG